MTSASESDEQNRPARKGMARQFAIIGLSFILTHALLLDAAIETHFSGSPLRWWISGTVGIYAIILALAGWWIGRSHAGAFLKIGNLVGLVLLIALVCCSSLHPAGLSDGVRLLGLTTSTVMVSVIMIAIALFGVLWGLASNIDYRIRIGVGVIALYGFSAFLLGVLAGTPFVELLNGGGLWSYLPDWLHGSVLGALLFLPVAFVHQVIKGILSVRRAALQIWSAKTISLALCILLAVQGYTYTGTTAQLLPTESSMSESGLTSVNVAQSVTVQSLTPAEGNPAALRQYLEENQAALDELDRMASTLKTMPTNEFIDPGVVVAQVGTNPLDLYQWVRDNTDVLPYRGALKGALGTLMERRGNSLDRSLLLAELLTLAGHHPRLGNSRLNKTGMAHLSQMLSAQNTEEDADAQSLTKAEISNLRKQIITRLADTTNAGLEEIEFMLEQWSASERKIVALIEDAEEQAIVLLNKLPRDHQIGSDLYGQAMTLLNDHWWVMIEIEGTQTALDLNFGPRAKSLLEMGYSETHPTNLTSSEAIEKFGHKVTLRVVATQRSSSGKDTDHIVLEHSMQAAEQGLKPFWLGFRSLDGSSQGPPSGARSLDDMIELLAQQREWLPFIWIEGKSITNSSVRKDGSLNDSPTVNDPENNALTGLASAFDSMPTGIGKPEPKPQSDVSQLARLQIEFITDSLVKVNSEKRLLFDVDHAVGGPTNPTVVDSRRATAFLTKHMFMVQGHDVPPEHITEQLRQNILLAFDLYKRFITAFANEETVSLDQMFGSLEPPPNLLNGFANLRRRYKPQSMAIVTPNLASKFQEFSIDSKEVRSSIGLDILFNDVLALTDNRTEGQTKVATQGVFDTLVESYLVSDGQSGINTAMRFREDLNAGTSQKWRVTDDVPFGPANENGIYRCASTSNRVVIAPPNSSTESPPPGYWSISRLSGNLLGYAHNGRGSDVVEFIFLWGDRLLTARSLFQLGDCVFGGFASMNSCAQFQCAVSAVSMLATHGIARLSTPVCFACKIQGRSPHAQFLRGEIGLYSNAFFELVGATAKLACADAWKDPAGSGETDGPVDNSTPGPDDPTDYGDDPADSGETNKPNDDDTYDADALTDYGDEPADSGNDPAESDETDEPVDNSTPEPDNPTDFADDPAGGVTG